MLFRRLLQTHAPAAVILIRLMVGAVFLSEGIQKFLFPEARGVGRFEEIGFASPMFWGYFVAVIEVVCGALILPGLLTRLAAIPLLIDMTVAIVITKLPIIVGHGFGSFTVRELDRYGFWAMAHEIRTDWSMWLGALFLLIAGAGRLSVDATLWGSTAKSASGQTAMPE